VPLSLMAAVSVVRSEWNFIHAGTASTAIRAPGTGRNVVNPGFHHTRTY